MRTSGLKLLRQMGFVLFILSCGPILMASCGSIKLTGDWRTADRSSTGMAPDPALAREAIIQVYAARAFNWRGIFAVHSWISIKPKDAKHYTVHQVMGWRRYRNLPVVISNPDAPDRSWYGARPELIAELRGDVAEIAIPKLEHAIREYPYQYNYVLWPGPNSNTFTAHVARSVPELKLDLPPTAIGKDYLPNGRLVASTPSGTGYQFSLFGLIGFSLATEEGLELNVLGLSTGIDPLDGAIKLPGIGRFGLR
jgi:hypothetical protein